MPWVVITPRERIIHCHSRICLQLGQGYAIGVSVGAQRQAPGSHGSYGAGVAGILGENRGRFTDLGDVSQLGVVGALQ
jgi:hypothetical protein